MSKVTLIKTLCSDNSTLYYLRDGRRIKFADCEVKLKIYENAVRVRALGTGAGYKTRQNILAITFNHEFTTDVTGEFLSKVLRFELKAEFQGQDGIFEEFFLDQISLLEMIDLDNLGDSWRFEVKNDLKLTQKLLKF